MRAREFISERRRRMREQSGLWYRGYPCTRDCSGHRAGYAWAMRRLAKTLADCGNPLSNSFWEGCKSWIEKK